MKLENEFNSAYPDREFILKIIRAALGVNEVTWDLLTIRNLTKVKDYIVNEKSANSAVTYCAMIKAFLAQYSDTGLIPCGNDYKKALKVRKEPSEQIALTEWEMALIESYEPKSKTEREVKAQFMCEYYSMARSVDIARFTEENIDTEKRIISYVAVKTKKAAKVPLHKNFMKYFVQRGDTHNRWVYNTTIKRICKKVGITQPVKLFYRGKEQVREKWELVGSHTARRSGATNLAKRGAPIPVIAKMMSHGQNTAMTNRYIWMDDIELDDKSAAFFQ